MLSILADVLAAVPRAGLDAVLVAVAIALEDVTPSGQVSVEHIENVLARLNSGRLSIPVPMIDHSGNVLAPTAAKQRYLRVRLGPISHRDGRIADGNGCICRPLH